MSVMLPSFSTTNVTSTCPCCFALCARYGYFSARLSHCMNSDIPPGNSGSSSMTRSGRALLFISTTGGAIGSSSRSCSLSAPSASDVVKTISSLSFLNSSLSSATMSTLFIRSVDVGFSCALATMRLSSCLSCERSISTTGSLSMLSIICAICVGEGQLRAMTNSNSDVRNATRKSLGRKRSISAW